MSECCGKEDYIAGLTKTLEYTEARLNEALAKLASVEALLPGPRTLAETLSRDFEGNMWPRTVFEDDLRAALGLTEEGSET